ncbi:MAG: hypothetical protein L0Y54_10450 [Sporichthyaceae bacterium]|nr:hypothetical protein [Sporichthyaceae bacterium]
MEIVNSICSPGLGVLAGSSSPHAVAASAVASRTALSARSLVREVEVVVV